MMLAVLRRKQYEPCALACIATACLVASGVGASESPNDGGAIASATAAIIAQVGDEFFRLYITPQGAHWYPPDAHCNERPNACADSVRNGYSFVTYGLRIPQSPFVDATIECTVDADGGVSNLGGAPDCVNYPRECMFPIDQFAAEAIADKAGLEPGAEAWAYHFHWHHRYQTYVWTVSSTLARNKSSGDGRVVVIDANDGRVLGIFFWSEMSW